MVADSPNLRALTPQAEEASQAGARASGPRLARPTASAPGPRLTLTALETGLQVALFAPGLDRDALTRLRRDLDACARQYGQALGELVVNGQTVSAPSPPPQDPPHGH
jgi:hypothetical protein